MNTKTETTKLAWPKAILFTALLGLVGCESNSEKEINSMEKPVIVVSCNEGGMVLRDAKGTVQMFDPIGIPAKSALKDGYTRGDVYIP